MPAPAEAFSEMVVEYGAGPTATEHDWQLDAQHVSTDVVLNELACGLAHEVSDDLPIERLHGRLSFSACMLALLDRFRRGKQDVTP
jgi:hypothetical protein